MIGTGLALAACFAYFAVLADWTTTPVLGSVLAVAPVLATGAVTWVWRGRRARVAVGVSMLCFSLVPLSLLMTNYLPAAVLVVAGGLTTPRVHASGPLS
jgi:hypothetical protein